jgi:hypothetical protein
VIDPAPAMEGGRLANSICPTRGHCDAAVFGAYVICMDCGYATESEVDEAHEDFT